MAGAALTAMAPIVTDAGRASVSAGAGSRSVARSAAPSRIGSFPGNDDDKCTGTQRIIRSKEGAKEGGKKGAKEAPPPAKPIQQQQQRNPVCQPSGLAGAGAGVIPRHEDDSDSSGSEEVLEQG